MNAVEIYEKASWDIEHNKITLGEFEERVKALYDVEPVRHGHWETVFDKIESNLSDIGYFKALPKFICSECGNEMIASTQYCPCCGAKMDKKEQEHNE